VEVTLVKWQLTSMLGSVVDKAKNFGKGKVNE